MMNKFKGAMDQFLMMQKMMKDENFRAFMGHPKVQELFKDPEFLALVKSQNFQKIATHPKFAVLKTDKELAELASKLNLGQQS